jgi:hypothetical protein
MAVGIGGGGFMGIAFEVLPAPVQSALATAASGGTILAGTYRYIVTAINANGQTGASNEQTITTTGSTSTVTVSWAAVPGATGYKLYKTAAGGAAGTELLYKTVGVVTTDIDTAPGTPTGAFPTANTATTPNTYAAPTKFFRFRSESLAYKQATQWRRTIGLSVDNQGAIPGNVNTEGEISMEAMHDVVPYFHCASRATVAKTGSGPYTYTCTPNPAATAQKTLSITIVRNGVVFGYTGCVVSSFNYTIDNGAVVVSWSIKGSDETSQTLPVPTFVDTPVFGAGQYEFQIPTPTVSLDISAFTFSVDDGADPQFRFKNTGRGAQFMKFGERNVTMTLTRDFETRTDYDAFKALTGQTFSMVCAAAGSSITLTAPSIIKDTYELGLSGQGDLITANISYQMVYDNTTARAYQIIIVTTENFVP